MLRLGKPAIAWIRMPFHRRMTSGVDMGAKVERKEKRGSALTDDASGVLRDKDEEYKRE